MKPIKMLAAAVLLPFMTVVVQALPFWTEKSSYVEGDYLYAVGIASEMEKEEAARAAAFENGVAEIKNFLLADDIGNLQTVETQMTYTERLPEGKFTVYRLLKVPLSSVQKYLDRKGETGERTIGGFDYAADSAAVSASSDSAAVITDTDTETGYVSIMSDDEDSLRDDYLERQLDSAAEADPVVINQSITNVTNIINYNPEYANAYYTRAALQVSVRNYSAAIDDINRAMKFRRQNPATSGFRTEAEYYALRAKAEHESGNYGSAVADLHRAAEQKRHDSKKDIFYVPGKTTQYQIWKQSDFEELHRRFPTGTRSETVQAMRDSKASADRERQTGTDRQTSRRQGITVRRETVRRQDNNGQRQNKTSRHDNNRQAGTDGEGRRRHHQQSEGQRQARTGGQQNNQQNAQTHHNSPSWREHQRGQSGQQSGQIPVTIMRPRGQNENGGQGQSHPNGGGNSGGGRQRGK